MKHRLRSLCLLSGLALIHPVQAGACTLAPGYIGPSNLDLAREADSIVLARVERQRRTSEQYEMPLITLRPVEAIKGPLPRGLLKLEGHVGSTQHVRASFSDPNELQDAHPQAGDGYCVRYVFMPGSTLLLFLERDGENWKPVMAPYARTAEDVPSRRSRWVKAVRLYARISGLPPKDQMAALRREQIVLRQRGSRDAEAIADDIDRVLAHQATLREELPDPFEPESVPLPK